MTTDVRATPRPAPPEPPRRVTHRSVVARRTLGVALVVVPLAWAASRALAGGTEIVNTGGLPVLGDLVAAVAHPALDPEFLAVVVRASVNTVVFAVLGTAGALVIGAVGGLVLSDVAWGPRPPAPVRLLRAGLRAVFVAVRSVHELIWALLLVSVLGLDPLVAVIAIALPFGAQTAKVVGDILDGVPSGPTAALRANGVRPFVSLGYGTLPPASPLLVSYAFYRFECSIRSAVILGVVGVGGLGSELVTSLRSRNWDEVWTLVGAVIVLCAVVEWWSSRVRGDLAVATCSDWAATEGPAAVRGRKRRSTRVSVIAALLLVAVSWVASGVSLAGLFSARTRERLAILLDDMWPPALTPGGWPEVVGATLDTLAMAVLATGIAVAVTLALGPFATRLRPVRGAAPPTPARWGRGAARTASGLVLLVLRSVPPTVWAAIVLLVLFPGVLPGALALGLYTGGILGRLVAEAWDGIDVRPRDALRAAGVRPTTAAVASIVPPSSQHLVTYTLYRFEICVRDTAVVGVVGAAGLGRLLAENLAVFRYPAVTTLLAASFVVSVAAEVASRRVRRSLVVHR